MASLSSATPREVVTVINSLLHLEESDQASLHDVIEDYFTTPGSSASRTSESESDSDSDSETDHGEGKAKNYYYTTKIRY